ncbi:hypothetical protein ID866_4631, partial [Astraeus odoratus]
MEVNDVCVHPNQGELISCDQAGCIKQWDLSENLCSHELVCTSNLQCFHLLNVLLQTPAGDVPIRSVSLASDGSCLVAGNNKGKCYVWKINEEKSDIPRYQAVTKFSAHKKYITRVLLSPDVKYLATCSADTTVKIWSISENYEFRQEKVLQGHQRWVWDCAFSADSAYLVTGTYYTSHYDLIYGIELLHACFQQHPRITQPAFGKWPRERPFGNIMGITKAGLIPIFTFILTSCVLHSCCLLCTPRWAWVTFYPR